MVDATTRYFEELNRRGFEPTLAKTSGTLRIDLNEGARTTHWLLAIDRGRLRVSQEDREADTVVAVDPGLFEKIVTGRENGLAALLRGDMTITGNARLLVQVERVFPGPPDARGPRRPAGRRAC
ncbi:SCP2 sterol-binding domain-containing protein [Micromonospora sp. WMMD882]|uniref:SCP2 sterol-binding domain-containing protein n=1 Tax=Micromonospora sp. WMMD882 TaxID=3015151 RepID=UPI00248AE9E8|nr:SCP2 sterol-binding domain-containing protein [Micromonospora sp. WMMD882]WBB79551.1 SCP2 sterol-binding domain-containing protein [Micromonospora sp. WMMD882]